MSHNFEFSGERSDLHEGDILRTDDDIAIGDIVVFERVSPKMVAIRLLSIGDVSAHPGKAYLVVPAEDGTSPLLVQLRQPRYLPNERTIDPLFVTEVFKKFYQSALWQNEEDNEPGEN